MPHPPADTDRLEEQLKRLLPLLPQLAMGILRNRGAVPPGLERAGSLGARHVAALVSLSVQGPATVTELAKRLDIKLNHASLVVRELGRAGLLDRREDDTDHRRVIVSIATARAEQVAETAARVSSPIRDFLTTIDPDEADRFITHVSTLAQHLQTPPLDENPVPAIEDAET
jgi:DNA-binding MarR family transcriptional regulator